MKNKKMEIALSAIVGLVLVIITKDPFISIGIFILLWVVYKLINSTLG